MTTKTAISPTRESDFPGWYQEVISAADLAEHSPVRGSMIIKPNGYAIWENIQKILDQMIKDTGHQNAYFPLLIPLSFLAKEAAHVEGFAKECAVVTHYRLETDKDNKLIPAPSAQLAEPLIIRPTSETIIGHSMAKWLNSYQDLPILLNQWCNVLRWEMRTRLFLRTAEFLWQEGHTAHETSEEAKDETLKMLDVYEKLLTEILAIPIIKGEKTSIERFPGADHTYTVEAMMQDGKALQAATSHFLGQNFSKAYEIKFTGKDQKIAYAWTTSWGATTRLIGAMVMVHGDDDGLVIPPRVAPVQVIIIPFIMKDEDYNDIMKYCEQLKEMLGKISYFGAPLRVVIDKSSKRSGEKFWNAVKKGIPIRLEIGLRDIKAQVFPISRRDKTAKEKNLIEKDMLLLKLPNILDEIQNNLFNKALEFRDSHTKVVHSLAELETLFGEDENSGFNGFAKVYFDQSIANLDEAMNILKRLKLSVRCIPFRDEEAFGKCIFSGLKTSTEVILARAY